MEISWIGSCKLPIAGLQTPYNGYEIQLFTGGNLVGKGRLVKQQ